MAFKQSNKKTEWQWIKKHRSELIHLGIPDHIIDDKKSWIYVLLHGEDSLTSGWTVSMIADDNVNGLLSLLCSFYSNPTGLELIQELKRRQIEF